MGPVGPLPLIRVRAPDGVLGREVGADEWRRLAPPAERYLPQPPSLLEDILQWASPEAEVRPHGTRRVGRRWRIYKILPPDGGEPWELGDLEPRAWDADQLQLLWRHALDILRAVGLSPAVLRTWCFRDSAGSWWALYDQTGDQFSLLRSAEDLPDCWPKPAPPATRPSPQRLSSPARHSGSRRACHTGTE